MDRVHGALKAATLSPDATLHAAQQPEAIGQGACDQRLSEIPLQLEQQASGGPSQPVISNDLNDRLDLVGRPPIMKLVVISNRGARFDPNIPQTGGLAAGLEPVLECSGAIWMFSSDIRGEGTEKPLPLEKVGKGHVAKLDLPVEHYPGYYRDYSNSTLWPALHSLSDRMSSTQEGYRSYREMNDFIARAAFGLQDRDAFWVHDYHLFPLAADLRKLGIEGPTGFFLHTPWPAPDMIKLVSNHRELMKSMLEYDLLGFQTNRDVNNFLACLRSHLALESKDGVVISERGQTRCQKFPIGIDPKRFAEYLAADLSPAEQEKVSSLLKSVEGTTFAIGVDRLDYTKGIDQKVEGFNQLLVKAEPRSISLLQIAPPSRADAEEYQRYRNEVESRINQVNAEHGTDEWSPIHYINESFSQSALARLYRAARVGVVTPLRDGMNLVAKEYVAVQNPKDPGVLVLSKFAGAAEDFNDKEALLVDPNRPEEIREAIWQAVNMPREERIRRWRSMMDKLEAYTIHHWSADYLRELDKSQLRAAAVIAYDKVNPARTELRGRLCEGSL
ncbi:trehalose-6-phosphate synthase [Bradyrhizobium sp. 164]|uniref:alpha,alpha-trehalose-phosphate synthase (UDP-forming) n=2 Tax=unclassified Bradyrhizobium TaxID=2631580 RepID=UPI001FF94328|nr:trehalose-6-phosphate synthase [Bradyrhizobium sp. 164]MCK1593413.1 trehalose-6-phosphate synthase [Bradyrhizobium sp. 164]